MLVSLWRSMKRTTIMLPIDLKAKAERKAREDRRSLGDIVRESLGRYLSVASSGPSDPLLSDEAVFKGPAPRDLSSEHDRYLYEDRET